MVQTRPRYKLNSFFSTQYKIQKNKIKFFNLFIGRVRNPKFFTLPFSYKVANKRFLIYKHFMLKLWVGKSAWILKFYKRYKSSRIARDLKWGSQPFLFSILGYNNLKRITYALRVKLVNLFFKLRRRISLKKRIKFLLRKRRYIFFSRRAAKRILYYWYFRKTYNNYFSSITNSKFEVIMWENSFTGGKYLGKMASSKVALEKLLIKLCWRFRRYIKNLFLDKARQHYPKRVYRYARHLKFWLIFMFQGRVSLIKGLFKRFVLKEMKRLTYIKILGFVYNNRIPFNGCYKKVRRRRKNRRIRHFRKRRRRIIQIAQKYNYPFKFLPVAARALPTKISFKARDKNMWRTLYYRNIALHKKKKAEEKAASEALKKKAGAKLRVTKIPQKKYSKKTLSVIKQKL